MVLYLVESDVPAAKSDEFSRWFASHVAKVVAAMGRNAFASRARVVGNEENGRFVGFYELPSIAALESYLMSRERAELAEETESQQPDVRVHRVFAERRGQPRRGMRFGEEPGAGFVVRVTIPAAKGDEWVRWYEEEHMAEVLADPGFVRARLWELPVEDESERRFLAVYDSVDLEAIGRYIEGRGPRLAEAHRNRFPEAQIERTLWEWLQ